MNCDRIVNECQTKNPFCHNDGICVTVNHGKAACQCKNNFVGKLCEILKDTCIRSAPPPSPRDLIPSPPARRLSLPPLPSPSLPPPSRTSPFPPPARRLSLPPARRLSLPPRPPPFPPPLPSPSLPPRPTAFPSHPQPFPPPAFPSLPPAAFPSPPAHRLSLPPSLRLSLPPPAPLPFPPRYLLIPSLSVRPAATKALANPTVTTSLASVCLASPAPFARTTSTNARRCLARTRRCAWIACWSTFASATICSPADFASDVLLALFF